MLRSRAARARARVDGEEEAGGSNDADDGGTREGRKVARSEEDAIGIGGGDGGGRASSGVGEVESGAFGDVVVRLVGLKPQGLFRTILIFL